MVESRVKLTVFLVTLLFPVLLSAQKKTLAQKIEDAAIPVKGMVGVAIQMIDDPDNTTLTSFNAEKRFPMQSVYKFPLAMAVMDQVDKGKFSLDQKIRIQKSDLLPNTWSPLAKKYPDGNVDVTLREILEFTVAQSDNNGCDILFRLMGGTGVVQSYIHGLGVKQIAITGTEEEMHKNYNAQFNNWCTPLGMLQLLNVFYKGMVLSPSSQVFLMETMTATITGPRRLRGLLPEGTSVAHRTGNSGPNQAGVIAAANDVGIITLPDGKHVAIVVYVSDTKADEKIIDNCIATISKAAWDHFTGG